MFLLVFFPNNAANESLPSKAILVFGGIAFFLHFLASLRRAFTGDIKPNDALLRSRDLVLQNINQKTPWSGNFFACCYGGVYPLAAALVLDRRTRGIDFVTVVS